MFEVRIEVFEGPFDLLLQLIMRQELEIHQVPVAQITASYLNHIESALELDLDTATEFVVIAATLLLIKARSLLPRPEGEEEMLEDTETARLYLVERLIEYKKFSSAAGWLEELYATEGLYVPRLRELERDYSHLYPDPFEGVPIMRLPETLIELLIERARDQVDTSYLAPIKVSVSEHMDLIRESLLEEKKTKFTELMEHCQSKLEVIATFLAILELYKKGEVELTQRRIFGDINIQSRKGEKSSAA